MVAGESAGSIPTPLYAGLVADNLPDAEIQVLADGSGLFGDMPAATELLGSNWGTINAIPDWPENAGMTVGDWSIPHLFIQAGTHAPHIVFARHDYTFDEVQSFFYNLVVGSPPANSVEQIDQNETLIEENGVELFSYISPGNSHTVLSRPEFYTEELNGVLLVDWVTDLVSGVPIEDEHCEECAG